MGKVIPVVLLVALAQQPFFFVSSHYQSSYNKIPPNAERKLVGKPFNEVDHDDSVGSSSRLLVGLECDAAFFECIPHKLCMNCYTELQFHEVNWAGVTQDTSCEKVLDYLLERDHCKGLHSDALQQSAFCKVFQSCAMNKSKNSTSANEDGSGGSTDGGDSDDVDCKTLTECNWPGFHESFLGDGVCNDRMHGCYNTAICHFDGGDCCPDTCKQTGEKYIECGHEKYACRDPHSVNCDPDLNYDCINSDDSGGDDGDDDEVDSQCDENEVLYRLVMYDSFGDGWGNTTIRISEKDSNELVYSGGLLKGSVGEHYICLKREPMCYHAVVQGGVWGKECSWEIRGMKEGAPAITTGGAPQDCMFAVSGKDCGQEKVCTGKSTTSDSDEEDGYKKLKDLTECIGTKCFIQEETCKNDDVCSKCLAEKIPDYCYAFEAFQAVLDCTMCRCTDKKGSDYCREKAYTGDDKKKDKDDDSRTKKDNYKAVECTPEETIAGGNAVATFSQCTEVESVTLFITHYNQRNFGDLDQFESCAHSYMKEEHHGGRTALGCLKILVNAMNSKMPDEVKPNTTVPAKAIAALAGHLYHNSTGFCECSKAASINAPLCDSFISLKVFLYEALDSCKALDEIDCDAWDEYSKQCQTNMEKKFGSASFSTNTEELCKYVHDENCGGAGPYPVFRHLDCDGEIPSSSWAFYTEFASHCLQDENGNPLIPPTKAPNVPTPVQPVTLPPTAKPKTASPVTPSSSVTPAPVPPAPTKPSYVPPEERDKPSKTKPSYQPPDDDDYADSNEDEKKEEEKKEEKEKPQKTKKRSHWFRNLFFLLLIGGGCYYYYKQRADGFSFVRYRRMLRHQYAGGNGIYGFSDDGAGMYAGVSMESSTAFQPPSLPLPPSVMGDGQYS